MVIQQWYLAHDQSVYGPMTTTELQRLAASGQLRPDDRITMDRQNWYLAKTINGLFQQQQADPIVPPPIVATRPKPPFQSRPVVPAIVAQPSHSVANDPSAPGFAQGAKGSPNSTSYSFETRRHRRRRWLLPVLGAGTVILVGLAIVIALRVRAPQPRPAVVAIKSSKPSVQKAPPKPSTPNLIPSAKELTSIGAEQVSTAPQIERQPVAVVPQENEFGFTSAQWQEITSQIEWRAPGKDPRRYGRVLSEVRVVLQQQGMVPRPTTRQILRTLDLLSPGWDISAVEKVEANMLQMLISAKRAGMRILTPEDAQKLNAPK